MAIIGQAIFDLLKYEKLFLETKGWSDVLQWTKWRCLVL